MIEDEMIDGLLDDAEVIEDYKKMMEKARESRSVVSGEWSDME